MDHLNPASVLTGGETPRLTAKYLSLISFDAKVCKEASDVSPSTTNDVEYCSFPREWERLFERKAAGNRLFAARTG
jgi:hypothetical protein